MSRAQEGEVAQTASDQNKAFNANAQTAFENAQGSLDQQQGDIADYKDELAKYAAGNPYSAGGAYQTAVNQSTAGSAAGAGQSATQGIQSAAVRGGINSGAAIGAGEKIAGQNVRDLMTTQARANADRISNQAGYNRNVLQASEVPATLQNAVTGQQGRLAESEAGAGNQALGINEKAAETPGFWDTFGESFAKGLGNASVDAVKGAAKALGA